MWASRVIQCWCCVFVLVCFWGCRGTLREWMDFRWRFQRQCVSAPASPCPAFFTTCIERRRRLLINLRLVLDLSFTVKNFRKTLIGLSKLFFKQVAKKLINFIDCHMEKSFLNLQFYWGFSFWSNFWMYWATKCRRIYPLEMKVMWSAFYYQTKLVLVWIWYRNLMFIIFILCGNHELVN